MVASSGGADPGGTPNRRPMPDNKPSPAEKRIFPRYELDTRIKVTGTREEKAVEWRGRTIDISEGGVAAVLSAELKQDEVVALEFTLPRRAEPIRTRAVVRHRQSFRYGLEFLGLSKDQRDQIFAAARLLRPAA